MSPSTTGLAEEVVAPDEAAVTAELIAFLEAASLRRAGTGPVRRFNQGRAAGCVDAELTVFDDLPPEHRVGLFSAPRTYRAFIRFANASSKTDRDRDVRGMSISLPDVPGGNLTAGVSTQDFVLNSHPVMVAPDAREFMAFLQAMEAGGLRRILHFVRHPAQARIGRAAQQQPSCHLDIPYWSTTPYLFGPGRAVKYLIQPCSDRTSPKPRELTDTYLSDALRAHLAQADACFDFMIQFQVDATRTPIEDATVEWQALDSPFHRVARIRIPRQGLDDPARASACEASAFSPWHCLPAHRPLGGMNRARREVYQALSRLRQQRG